MKLAYDKNIMGTENFMFKTSFSLA